jgi:SAM-dependent methyltransferase
MKNINTKSIAEQNRLAWNEAIMYHQKARNNSLQNGFKKSEFTTLNRDSDKYLLPKLKRINLRGKTIAQLPCNNGRELLSLLKFGAEKAVGFDISDIAIDEAKELTDISGLNAEFFRTNILEINTDFHNQFDIIYISEGSLQWFPSLDDYFKIVSNLLKKDGQILIFEMHPFSYFFEQAYELDREITLDDLISYFEKGPYSYDTGMDYVGQTKYQAKPCSWFMHKFSDIFSAIIKNGIMVTEFEEFNAEMAGNMVIKHLKKFPLSYIMIGQKK